jgi:hypothetical protein
MGKLIAIVGVAVVLAGGGTYALVCHNDAPTPGDIDPADCPVVKVGGCPYCNGATQPASTASEAADACCADAGTLAHVASGDGSAAVAVAGPAVMLGKAKAARKACCCCDEEPAALTALVGIAATAK